MFSFSEGAIWLGFHYQLQQLGWYSFQLVSLCVSYRQNVALEPVLWLTLYRRQN